MLQLALSAVRTIPKSKSNWVVMIVRMHTYSTLVLYVRLTLLDVLCDGLVQLTALPCHVLHTCSIVTGLMTNLQNLLTFILYIPYHCFFLLQSCLACNVYYCYEQWTFILYFKLQNSFYRTHLFVYVVSYAILHCLNVISIYFHLYYNLVCKFYQYVFAENGVVGYRNCDAISCEVS